MGRLNIARKIIATKVAMPLVMLSSMGLSGCMQRVRNSPPEQMVLPVVADEAMQKRDWAQSSAIYPNGATAAGHTDFPFEPKPDQTWYLYAVADSWVFVVNAAILPYELFKDPPYQLTIHQGNTYPPSYNAMPVLPPSQTTEEVSYPGVPLIVPIPAASSSTKQTAMPGQIGSHGTTSPTTHPTYHPLPTQPGAQPTGSPLVTPGRGQPTAPPITLPPATPTHPSTQPTYPSGQPSASIKPPSGGTQSAYAPSTYSPSPKTSVTATPAPVVSSTPSASSQLTLTPKASTPAPTVAPQPSVTIAPTTRPANNDLESSSALDLSLAPSIPPGQTVETRIVGGKLTLVPSSQPTTKPTTNPVNWPPLNK